MALELHGEYGITYPSWTTATRPTTANTGLVGYNTTLGSLEFYNGTSWKPVGSIYDTATSSTGYFQIPVGTTAQRPASPATGMLRYNTTISGPEIYTGTYWAPVVAALYGAAANPAQNAAQIKSQNSSDGVYYYSIGGTIFQAYTILDNTYDSGGWTLLYNIDTTQANTNALGGIPHFNNTTFWTTINETNPTNTTPWSTNVKTRAYDLLPITEILIVVSKRTGYVGSVHARGWSVYVNANYANQTFYNMLTLGTANYQLSTAGRKTGTNYSGNLTWNSRRTQTRGGDLFIDGTVNGANNASDNLVLNQRAIWGSDGGADNNRARMGTTAASNTTYDHTFGGIGVVHAHGTWSTYAAFAPITPYCEPPTVYGTTTDGINYANPGIANYGNIVMNTCENRGWADGTLSVSVAVFARQL